MCIDVIPVAAVAFIWGAGLYHMADVIVRARRRNADARDDALQSHKR